LMYPFSPIFPFSHFLDVLIFPHFSSLYTQNTDFHKLSAKLSKPESSRP
jgi:hypothetical protein